MRASRTEPMAPSARPVALGYGPHKGRRLKEIARNSRFGHTAHAPHLPASWMTLFELTRLTEPQWEYGLRTGIIRPDTTPSATPDAVPGREQRRGARRGGTGRRSGTAR